METKTELNFVAHMPSLPPLASTHLPVKDVCVIVNIVGQQVGLRPHEQSVPNRVWTQLPGSQTSHCLVDVKERDVGVQGALGQSVSCRFLTPNMRVVDENLTWREEKERKVIGSMKHRKEALF